MFHNPAALPLPEKGVMHPVHITKVISLEKICFRLLDKKEDYVNLVKELQRYYAEKVSPSIENLPEGSVNGRFFIFKRDGLYHRVTVIKAWPNKTYHVNLIDEGFNCIAREMDLILNTTDRFVKYPAQAFALPLQIDQLLVMNKEFMINYGLQKMSNTKTDFYAAITYEDKLQLYFKDQNQGIVSVNDFLTEFLKKSVV